MIPIYALLFVASFEVKPCVFILPPFLTGELHYVLHLSMSTQLSTEIYQTYSTCLTMKLCIKVGICICVSYSMLWPFVSVCLILVNTTPPVLLDRNSLKLLIAIVSVHLYKVVYKGCDKLSAQTNLSYGAILLFYVDYIG